MVVVVDIDWSVGHHYIRRSGVRSQFQSSSKRMNGVLTTRRITKPTDIAQAVGIRQSKPIGVGKARKELQNRVGPPLK